MGFMPTGAYPRVSKSRLTREPPHSTAGILGRFFANPEIDRLADEGRAETDPRARHSLYRRVEEIAARDALVLPLFHDQVYAFVRPEVEGFDHVGQASPTINYEELWIRR